MTRNVTGTLPILGLTALFAACGGSAETNGAAEASDAASSPTATDPQALVGQWLVVGIDLDDGEELNPSADAIPFFNFTAEANPTGSRIFNGSGGCNRVMGGYDAGSTGRITFSNGPAMTMMACPEPVMHVEQALMMGLEAARTYEVDGDRLVIRFEGGALRLERAEG